MRRGKDGFRRTIKSKMGVFRLNLKGQKSGGVIEIYVKLGVF